MILHDANNGGADVVVPADSIRLVRANYPGTGQTWVETEGTATPIIQVEESAEEVERLRLKELGQ